MYSNATAHIPLKETSFHQRSESFGNLSKPALHLDHRFGGYLIFIGQLNIIANVCKSETDPNETFLGQEQISMGIEVFALTMAVAQVVIYCGLIGETLSFGFIPI